MRGQGCPRSDQEKKPVLYPIRAVSLQTGISIETLRAWERRYQVVTPQRGERGRLFTEADIRRLRMLRMAVEQGHSIGQLARLSDDALQALTTQPALPALPDSPPSAGLGSETAHPDLHLLMAGIERLDYGEVERQLSLLAAVLPPRELVRRVVLPLLQQVGDAWHAGKLSIAQEHMTSALLRNLLGALIPLHRRAAPPAKLLFAAPAREQHEFGILLSAILAVGGGLGIVYLGTDLPAEEIVVAAQKTAPQAVVIGVVGGSGHRLALQNVQQIAERLPAQIEFWVGGAKDPALLRELRQTRALLLEDFDLLEQHLIRLGARL
jgi:MerR family transcriptional regulator, light-induced transcriptional regulator